MDESELRFEWRVWAPSLDPHSGLLRQHGIAAGARRSTETYLVAPTRTDVNPKIRDGRLDIKVRRDVIAGFERWKPLCKLAFPVSAADLRQWLFGPIGFTAPTMGHRSYDLNEFLGAVVAPHPGLQAVGIVKYRHDFRLAGCIAEAATVTVADCMLETIAVESSDLDALDAARRLIGLEGWENVSYPTAIVRLLGVVEEGEPGG
jgi:hypothetical protein